MTTATTALVKEMQKNCREAGIPNNLQLPSGIQFITREFAGSGADVHLHLSADSVVKNMQEDANAFEAWMFILRRWTKNEIMSLSWDEPDAPAKNGHYQRFLYRVEWMLRLYPDWFNLAPGMDRLLSGMRLNSKSKFLLNFPQNEGTTAAEAEFALEMRESALEHFLISQPDRLLEIANLKELYYQLPVGVFEGSISSSTHVFTGGKSAIDLWGVNDEGDAAIFELKNSKNTKAGVLSELLFYSFIMLDTMGESPRFAHGCTGSVPNRCTREALNKLHHARSFTAYTLAPAYHTAIDPELFNDINQHKDLPNSKPQVNYKGLSLSLSYQVDHY